MPLASASKRPKCRIVGLKGCDDDFEIIPLGGEFSEEGAAARIVIHAVQDVTLRVHFARKPNDEWVLFIKPSVQAERIRESPLTIKEALKVAADMHKERAFIDQQIASAEVAVRRFEAALAIPAGRTADVRQLNELGKKEAAAQAAELNARAIALDAQLQRQERLLETTRDLNERGSLEVEIAK